MQNWGVDALMVSEADLDAAAVALIEVIEEIEFYLWPLSWYWIMQRRRYRRES